MHRFLVLFPLALLLAGCIEGEEEIWLEPDGSGRLEASYKMPPSVMQSFGGPEELARTLEEAAARDRHVHLTRISHRTDRGSIIFEFAGTFDDLRKLCTFPQRQLRDPDNPDQPVPAEALFGVTNLKITPFKISLQRTVDISGVLPKNFKRAPALLGKSNFHYILNLPVEARMSNASNLLETPRKLEWTFLLRDHATEPMILTAEGRLPVPRWLWFAAIALLIALLAITSLAFRTRRRRNRQSP